MRLFWKNQLRHTFLFPVFPFALIYGSHHDELSYFLRSQIRVDDAGKKFNLQFPLSICIFIHIVLKKILPVTCFPYFLISKLVLQFFKNIRKNKVQCIPVLYLSVRIL